MQDPTPRDIHRIAIEVRDGTADPIEIQWLLRYFCTLGQIRTELQTHQYLLEYLQDSFREYLSGAKTLEAALGLRRKRGKPHTEEADMKQVLVARDVLRHLLAGSNLETAAETVATSSEMSESQVRENWRFNIDMAIAIESLDRIDRGDPFSDDETKRLEKIKTRERKKLQRNPPV